MKMINYTNLIDVLISRIPEYKEYCLKKSFTNFDLPNLSISMLQQYFIEQFRNEDSSKKDHIINDISNYLEDVFIDQDPNAINTLYVSFLEGLDNSKRTLLTIISTFQDRTYSALMDSLQRRGLIRRDISIKIRNNQSDKLIIKALSPVEKDKKNSHILLIFIIVIGILALFTLLKNVV